VRCWQVLFLDLGKQRQKWNEAPSFGLTSVDKSLPSLDVISGLQLSPRFAPSLVIIPRHDGARNGSGW
jgi:hypothetical protein